MIVVLGFERDHDSVADRRRLTIERLGRRDSSAAAGRAPGDEAIELHHPRGAKLGPQLSRADKEWLEGACAPL